MSKFAFIWIVAFGFCLIQGHLEAGSQWASTLGPVENVRKLDLATDGSLYVGGWIDGNSFWVAKMNPDGAILWQVSLPDTMFLDALRATPDGGVIVSGWGFWTFKLDADGNVQWQQRYGVADLTQNRCRSIEATSDGGYLLSGQTTSFGNGNTDIWVIKVDSAGAIQWQEAIGTPGEEQSWGVREISSGVYAVMAQTSSFGTTGSTWLLKLDSSGALLSQKLYGTTPGTDNFAFPFDKTSDGGFAVVGNFPSTGKAWVLRIAPDDSVSWMKSVNSTGSQETWGIHQTTDGGFVIVGSDDAGNAWSTKLDSTGTTLWQKTISNDPDQSLGYAVTEFADGSLVLAGNRDNDPGFVQKTDPNGNIGPTCDQFADTSFTLQDVTTVITDTDLVPLETLAVPAVTTVVPVATTVAPVSLCQFGCPEITVTPASLTDAIVGSFYTQTFTAQGGTEPYIFSMPSGSTPPDIEFDAPTATISGISQTVGSASFTIQAQDAFFCTGTQSYVLNTVCPTITLAPASLADGTVGSAYNATITASGGNGPYGFQITSGTLPSGLTLHSSTGVIDGTPDTSGTFSFTVTGTDSNGCTGSKNYQISVSCPTIVIGPASLAGGTIGTAYNDTVTASGGTAPYTFQVSTGTLPTGLTLHSSTGVIDGTPNTSGTFSFTVTGTDSNGCTGSKNYQISISCSTITIGPASLPDGTNGTPYNTTVTASGGTAPYTFQIAIGTLPTGLTLHSSTGVIDGTPSASGGFSFTVSVTDSLGCSATKDFEISVSCPVITLTPASLPDGAKSAPYDVTIVASGGAAPYTFQVSAGTLPSGLSLNSSTGEISGTPDTPGTFSFTVTADDANGCPGSKNYQILIACAAIVIGPASLPAGTNGAAYNATITATGGNAPYTFQISTGSLPPGLSLNSSTGVISGTPNTSGGFSFTVTVSDSLGCSATRDYQILVSCPVITISPNSLPDGAINTAYNETLTASGGVGPYSFAVTAGQLPAGLTLDSGTIHGTPTTPGASNFTIQAQDANGCTSQQAYSIVIGCLFCDDFEDGILSSGWTYKNTHWSETGGNLVGTGGPKTSAVASPIFSGCTTCTIQTDFTATIDKGSSLWLLGWVADKKNRVELQIKLKTGQILLTQKTQGHGKAKAKATQSFVANTNYNLQLSYDGAAFHLLINGNSVLNMNARPGSTPSGTVGFQVKRTIASFQSITVF